jgi:peptidoglycan/LPS O-acetylase OafA/YrhL
MSRPPTSYLPTLDGWRAIAILSVIFYHDSVHTVGLLSTRWFYDYGEIGVDVFFAISGILICSRLLEEEKLNGQISLKNFYIRRGFRIVPPALLYLLVIASLAAVSIISVPRGEWFESLLFFRNYPTLLGPIDPNASSWYTGHFWSLSLEEQFYLFLPTLLRFAPRRSRIAVLATLSLLIAVHRVYALHHRRWSLIRFHTDIRLDALLVPALFALLLARPHIRSLLQKLLRFWPLLAGALVILVSYGEGTAWRISAIILLMPCVVLGSVLNPQSLLSRLLEWHPLRFVGRISYSLYLWQQLFFSRHFQVGDPLGVLQSWPLRLVITFACALASYYLIERPMTRIGHRLASSGVAGRPDFDSSNVSKTKDAVTLTTL